jgi:hypothetical protein
MHFVYLGPPDEPEVAGTFHAMTGEWVTGEPREISDPEDCAWLKRHPHWAEVVDAVAEEVEGDDAGEPIPVPPRRGRPRKVV